MVSLQVPAVAGKVLEFQFTGMVVPWVVTWNQIVGGVTKANQPNRQNIG